MNVSESNKKWLELWNKRAMDIQLVDSLLCKLIKVDGFDHPEVGDYNEEEWIKLCSHSERVIGLKENDKVNTHRVTKAGRRSDTKL
ncbi:uncharacterized protein METZ01_LOCUS411317 [marine metagenome]|uniref:Uncharacterized protein n=1 Tax=marine metagenome TaxID=408172 RepID=A0A382WI50_9ZZZZ